MLWGFFYGLPSLGGTGIVPPLCLFLNMNLLNILRTMLGHLSWAFHCLVSTLTDLLHLRCRLCSLQVFPAPRHSLSTAPLGIARLAERKVFYTNIKVLEARSFLTTAWCKTFKAWRNYGRRGKKIQVALYLRLFGSKNKG